MRDMMRTRKFLDDLAKAFFLLKRLHHGGDDLCKKFVKIHTQYSVITQERTITQTAQCKDDELRNDQEEEVALHNGAVQTRLSIATLVTRDLAHDYREQPAEEARYDGW